MSSDSSIMSGLSEEVPGPSSPSLVPPPLPPNHPVVDEEFAVHKEEMLEIGTTGEWTIVDKSVVVEEMSELSPPATPSTSSSGSTPGKIKWKKPRWAKKC